MHERPFEEPLICLLYVAQLLKLDSLRPIGMDEVRRYAGKLVLWLVERQTGRNAKIDLNFDFRIGDHSDGTQGQMQSAH